MVRGVRRQLWLYGLLVSAAGASACASTNAVARPSPFPLAPPPAALGPATPRTPPAPDRGDLVHTALGFRGVPYRMGGESPKTGFDCSGFVQYVFAANHVVLPRTVIEQYQLGKRVTTKDIRAGDLVYFSTTAPGATHVGIAVDHETFVHAPTSNGAVRVERLDSSYWQKRFIGAKRIV